jgi:hypothetical protein
MWSHIDTATGVGAAPVAASLAARTIRVATRSGFAGGLIGGVLVVGVMLVGLKLRGHLEQPMVGSTPMGEGADFSRTTPSDETTAPLPTVATPIPIAAASPTLGAPPPASVSNAVDPALAKGAQRARRSVGTEESLSREATLVLKARQALRQNDPAMALSALAEARTLPARQLEPETLAIEVRALRALGRDDDAARVDTQLRAKFPGHMLSR